MSSWLVKEIKDEWRIINWNQILIKLGWGYWGQSLIESGVSMINELMINYQTIISSWSVTRWWQCVVRAMCTPLYTTVHYWSVQWSPTPHLEKLEFHSLETNNSIMCLLWATLLFVLYSQQYQVPATLIIRNNCC